MYRKIFIFLLIAALPVFSEAQNNYAIGNERVRLVLEKKNGVIVQHFFAKKENTWVLMAQSFQPPSVYPDSANQLFNIGISKYRYLASQSGSTVTITKGQDYSQAEISGERGGVQILQTITLKKDEENFHIKVRALLPKDQDKLEYILSCYRFNQKGVPDFIHTPTLKYNEERWETPEKDQILGDRSFHSPAIVLQQKKLFFSLVPDLDVINDHRVLSPDARRTIKIPRNQFSVPVVDSKYTMPTGLDMNVRSGLTEEPILSFGYIDNIIQHHIRYLHPNDGQMVRTVDSKELVYAFDLFVSANKKESCGYQDITRFIWKNYGHHIFTDHQHLAMPFAEYVRTISGVTFSPMDVQPPVYGYTNTGSFLGFEMNGVPVGGFRSAVPGWTDALWNSAFWNNARDAVGMHIWAKTLHDTVMMDRAKRTINLLVSAPQNDEGLFPLIYRASAKKWQTSSYDVFNRKFGLFSAGPESETYDLSVMSKTCAHLLDYYQRCEADQRIITFTSRYADWLTKIIDSSGLMPSYTSTSMKNSEILRYSAQSAASMWFLAELFSVTRKESYLQAAQRIAAFLEKEVLPRQRWIDLEQYFSCGIKSLTFKGDQEQGELARGNLSVAWAADGFASLYKATRAKRYLDDGEKCIDYLTFTQCSWNPHYIYTAYPFGGFSVDNSDHATYLDARQAEYVRPLIWYGQQLGRADLVERGVAAARASVVLINHPLHKMNGIYEYTNIYGFGLGPENIDHEGHPQSAMRTHAGWGEGSGIFAGLSDAMDALGSAYVNPAKKIAVGVDGISITSWSLKNNILDLKIEAKLPQLAVPFDHPYTLNVKLEGLDRQKTVALFVNEKKIKDLKGHETTNVILHVTATSVF